MDEKIRAEFFSRRFSLMQGTILGQIDEELDDDVFVKLITAYFHTVLQHFLGRKTWEELIDSRTSGFMHRVKSTGGNPLISLL